MPQRRRQASPRIDLIRALAAIDKHGVHVQLKRDIEKMFPEGRHHPEHHGRQGQALRIAAEETAYRDLMRVGRNVGMVDLDEV